MAPLTQQEDVIRVKAKGMQLNNGTHGNLYIKLNYRIPKQLTDEQKNFLENKRITANGISLCIAEILKTYNKC